MGWTSKVPPSRGIETRGKASGTVGVDFIHGEQAVVDYAMKTPSYRPGMRHSSNQSGYCTASTDSRASFVCAQAAYEEAVVV
ncbi:hypothetical protein PInf_002559 [Phytophthora infestans]|nr:hypothetical protein PInf_002559 [Phytophthora infestans]